MNGILPDEERCTERVMDQSGLSHRCIYRAKEDGLCGIHLKAVTERRKADAEQAELDRANRANLAHSKAMIAELEKSGIAGRPDYHSIRHGRYTGGVVIGAAALPRLVELLSKCQDGKVD